MLGTTTRGEGHFRFALIAVAIIGAVFTHNILQRYAAVPVSLWHLDALGAWALCAGALGGLAGFLSCAHVYLGFIGLSGGVRATVGGLLITGIATIVAGTLILPYYGTMFAPFQFLIALIETPVLGLCWLAFLACLHKLMQTWRLERDSIFLWTVEDRF